MNSRIEIILLASVIILILSFTIGREIFQELNERYQKLDDFCRENGFKEHTDYLCNDFNKFSDEQVECDGKHIFKIKKIQEYEYDKWGREVEVDYHYE